MIVYSKNIVRFVHEIKRMLKNILSQEVGLDVRGERFYNRQKTSSYPIQVVIYNNRCMLGYFDPNFYEIGFHECLMHVNKKQLHDLIRHELAHYLTFIRYGENIQPHGKEFRAYCEEIGWGEEVYKATTCLEGGQEASEIEESAIFRKIQKLMALANSTNKNEAEQAMIKSQQLLLKHNLESTYANDKEEEKIFLKRIMKQKKENAKMRAIAKILGTFFVSVVYNRGGGFIYLEILGNAVNVEIAEYVAGFLDHELDNLWNQGAKQAQLKGLIAKNSFFLGLAKGYCNKIQALKQEYHQDVKSALIVLENKLIDVQEMVYKRLSSKMHRTNICKDSSALGERMGKQLSINPAINKSSKGSRELLIFSK